MKFLPSIPNRFEGGAARCYWEDVKKEFIGGAFLMWWLIFALLGVSILLSSSMVTDSKIKELEKRVSELENSQKD